MTTPPNVREGNVIVRHIATGSALVPTDAHALIKMDQAFYYRTLQLYPAIAALVYPIMVFPHPRRACPSFYFDDSRAVR